MDFDIVLMDGEEDREEREDVVYFDIGQEGQGEAIDCGEEAVEETWTYLANPLLSSHPLISSPPTSLAPSQTKPRRQPRLQPPSLLHATHSLVPPSHPSSQCNLHIAPSSFECGVSPCLCPRPCTSSPIETTSPSALAQRRTPQHELNTRS